MKNVKRTVLIVAALGLISAPVLAGQVMNRLDSNGDDKITLQEMQAQANKRFQAQDSNHDGQISISEQRQGCHGRHRHKQSEQGQTRRQGFRGPDADKNGAISQAESQAAVQKRFERLDANHDGVISADEIQAMQARRGQRQSWRQHRGWNLTPNQNQNQSNQDQNLGRNMSQDQTLSEDAGPRMRHHRQMI